MTLPRVLAAPRVLDWSIRIDRAPALLWIGCIAAALLPTWAWMARRLADGSGEPLGGVAIGALALVLWRHRARLRVAPRLGWLAMAAAGTLAATLAMGVLPPLAVSLVALAAFGAVLAAFLPSIVPTAPVVALALLSLPFIEPLEAWAGPTLHTVTAEATRWLLAPAFAIERHGAVLLLDGQRLVVDTPSGPSMLWLGCFTASMVAVWTFRSSHSFLARLLPALGCVFVGHVVLDTLRVAAPGPVPDALGWAMTGIVCGAIAWIMVDEGARHV